MAPILLGCCCCLFLMIPLVIWAGYMFIYFIYDIFYSKNEYNYGFIGILFSYFLYFLNIIKSCFIYFIKYILPELIVIQISCSFFTHLEKELKKLFNLRKDIMEKNKTLNLSDFGIKMHEMRNILLKLFGFMGLLTLLSYFFFSNSFFYEIICFFDFSFTLTMLLSENMIYHRSLEESITFSMIFFGTFIFNDLLYYSIGIKIFL